MTTQNPSKNFNVFRILHIVQACLAFMAMLAMLLFSYGSAMLFDTFMDQPGFEEIPFDIAAFYQVFGVIAGVWYLFIGLMNLLTARAFNQRRGYGIALTTSIINCLSGVLGMVLAIFTLIEIHKPGTKEMLKGDSAPEPQNYAQA